MMDEKVKLQVTPGLADDLFLRGQVPMTKEEIRVLTLTKLHLSPGDRVLDVGAGTGSITIECARLLPDGFVYAVEKNPEALELLASNCTHFGLTNIQAIKGEAPESLAGLPPLDAAVIGGSGGRLKEIIAEIKKILKPGGRLVINAILLETVIDGLTALQEEGFLETGLIHVNISRAITLGTKTALQPLNPVFIAWGEKGKIR